MRAIVLYESRTGNTERAGRVIAEGLRARGHEIVGFSPVGNVDLDGLSQADLVVIGSWTDGLFAFAQRPGGGARLRKLPSMRGKRAVVYCTYAVNPGKTVTKLWQYVAWTGADVLGGLALHRNRLEEEALDFAVRVDEVVPA